MARPKNAIASVKITVTASPRMRDYLADLVKEEGYGSSVSEVARTLVWRGIEDLLVKQIISRKRSTTK
jgi:hypothetical protein